MRCVFDIQATVESNRDMWLSRFGEVPRLRFAIHGGPVITAEIGVDHHKITYFGDTVNTTSRLESLSKMLGHPVLISADLAHRLVLPERRSQRISGRTCRERSWPDAGRLHTQPIPAPVV